MNNEMKGMIKKYIPIIFFALVAISPFNLYGTHLVGGDMTFECLGNDYYEITLVVRRDCINGAEDAPFDDPAAVGIFDGTGRKLDWLGRLGILYLPFSGAEIVKNNVPDCAFDGELVCVEQAIYKGSIYLPFREQGYVLTYQRCCRNGTINNIINPLDVGVTRFVCLIPETLTSCNSSPTFNDFPDVIVCANESLSFDASATDPDGDMLVYKLYTSHIGAAKDYPQPQPPWNPPYEAVVEYASGFSEDNMLGSGTSLSIDENTGLITAEPTTVGQYLVGILVEEWRDGKKLSETRRDFEYNVRVCLPFPVAAFDVEDDTCDGLTVSVTNNSTDAASYLWNFNHPSEDEQFIRTEESPAPFTYAEPGFYSIRLEVMDADGRCTVDEIKEVNVFDSGLTSSFESSNGCCSDGETELSLTATSTEPDAGHAIESYSWEISLNGEVPMSFSGESVTLTVGCTDEVSVKLTTTSTTQCTAEVEEVVPLTFPAPVSLDETIEICPGETAILTGFAECLVFDWGEFNEVVVSGETGFEVSPDETTVYNVTVTNGVDSEEGSVTVVVNPLPEIAFGVVPLDICENQGRMNVIDGNPDFTYEWSPTDGLDFTNGNHNPIFNPSEDTEYSVTITSDKGCQIVETIFVDVNTFPVQFFLDRIVVEQDVTFTDGTFDITISDNTGDVPGLNVEAITYAITIGDRIFIFEETPVVLEDIQLADDCVVNYQLLISHRNVIAKDTNRLLCDIIIEGSFLVKPPCEVGNQEFTICIGSSATIGPLNESCTYEWTPSDASLDLSDPLNPVFSPIETTVYTVIVTDTLGTTTEGSVTVNVVGTFGLEIEPEEGLLCQTEGMFTAIANREDLTYVWARSSDFADTVSTFNPATIGLMAGENKMYVRATSPEGCQEVAFTTVDMSTISVTASAEDYNACTQGSTSVTVENQAPDQNISVTWTASDNILSDNLNALSVNAAVVGTESEITLEYTVTNEDGCEFVGTIEVPVTRSMSASIAGSLTSCDGFFTLSGASNGINPTFEWSLSPDFIEIIGTEPILELELEEDATIYLRAASSVPGCFSDIVSEDLSLASFDVSFDDNLPSEICLGDMLLIEGMVSDESATITYGPSDNIVETPSSTSVVIQALEGQTEVILPFVAENDVGCTVEGILFFDVGTNDPPEVTIDVDCTTGTVTFNTGEVDGTLNWDFGDPSTSDDVSDLGSPSYTYPEAGTYTVTISSNKPTCEFETFDTTVVVPELFSLTTEDDTDVKYCNDDPVKLTVMTTGDVTVRWEDMDGNELATGNELNFNPNGEVNMVFAIAVSNDENCGNDTIKFSLEQYNFDLTSGEIPPIICAGDEFMLSITDNTGADLTYEWLPASACISGCDTPNPTLVLDDDTDVVVRVTNAEFMCTMEVVFPVDVIVVDLNVGADPDPNIFLCDEVVIFAESDIATEYSWSNGVSGPTQSVAPEETTTYTVTATDPNGCTSTGSVTITVEVPACDETGIFIPSAFSPNGDGSNDQLLVRSNAVKDMDFSVVDRWGDEVFRTTNQRVGWNGRFLNDGNELSPDVYAWCLIGRCSNNENIKMTGSVTLLR